MKKDFIRKVFFIAVFVLLGNFLTDFIIPNKNPAISGLISGVSAVIGVLIEEKLFPKKD